jgi:hypothetical protein
MPEFEKDSQIFIGQISDISDIFEQWMLKNGISETETKSLKQHFINFTQDGSAEKFRVWKQK